LHYLCSLKLRELHSIMYEYIRGNIFFFMFYASVAMLSLIACCYLLFRQGNAFAKEITPPVHLRRWTAAFFAAIALSHMWYIPMAFLSSSDDVMIAYYIGVLLDCMIIIPLAIIVLLAMLQDRRRPLWPFALMAFLPVVIMAWCVVSRSDALIEMIRFYLLLLGIGVTVYMVHAVRQYGRWLRDNFADLEHKEVWMSFVVLAIILLVFGIYALGINSMTYLFIVQICNIVLICYLLWRVETLSDLSTPQSQDVNEEMPITEEKTTNKDLGPLLQKCCIDTQLYLQHDLTIIQLAKAIGTNRTYLSQYFVSLDTTYNAYINNLRINHFVSLYREAVATRRPFSAKQLASDSGYRSYSTFALAFKQRMGQSVTAWMRDLAV